MREYLDSLIRSLTTESHVVVAGKRKRGLSELGGVFLFLMIVIVLALIVRIQV